MTKQKPFALRPDPFFHTCFEKLQHFCTVSASLFKNFMFDAFISCSRQILHLGDGQFLPIFFLKPSKPLQNKGF